MTAHGWLGVSMALGIAVAAFAACKGAATSETGGSAGGTMTAAGGADGGTATGTGGQTVDAGPIVCLANYTSVDKNGPCNLINQDCPAGDTCLPSGLTTACEPSTGLKGANELCYAPDECDAKLDCVGLNQTVTPPHPGNCLAFCCNDSSNEPCQSGICNVKVTFPGGAYAFMCAYGQRCQLFTEGACPPGYDCHVELSGGSGVAICLAPSITAVPELSPCTYINDCGNMQECWPGANVCLYYCELSGPTADAGPGLGGCSTGETCESSYMGAPADTGIAGVGICIPNGGLVPDAGAGDAGDAGTGDAGDAGDADTSDADTSDAGDAGTEDGSDAGASDAGDAGTEDGGDAGTDDGGDAGTDDAGIMDAGID